MDNDWLNSLFDDPVLNDKMMTEAVQPPCIKSEHSYSITNSDHNPASPLPLGKLEGLSVWFFENSLLPFGFSSRTDVSVTLCSNVYKFSKSYAHLDNVLS